MRACLLQSALLPARLFQADTSRAGVLNFDRGFIIHLFDLTTF